MSRIHVGGFRAVGFGCVLCALVCHSSAAAQEVALPPARHFDPTKGVIDGRVACGLWPKTADSKPADPAGFEAHIAPRSDLEVEVTHPAGEWFFPPSDGAFLVWLESPAHYLISPSPTPLNYQARYPSERGLALVGRVVPAGRVRLESAVCGGGCTFGLIHANSQVEADRGVRPEMKRATLESTGVEQGALMPAGAVAATLYDERLKEYRAIEAPIVVPARQTVVVHPKPPGPGLSDLVVVLTRPALLRKVTDEDVVPRLSVAPGKNLAPVFSVSGPRRLYAIWKGVAAGKAQLLVESKTVRFPQTEIILRPGHVESLEGALVPLPRLGVRLDLPGELRRGPLRVSVSGAQAPVGTVAREVAAGAERVEFERVPAAALRVLVVAGRWELEGTVDLTDGRDGEVTVSAELVTLEGTVYYGSDPRQAQVSFMTNHEQDKVTVEADSKGRYHLVLARPSTYIVLVQFPDRGRPFLMGLDVFQSGRQDLRVPANDFRIRVVRGDTGAPIPKAEVGVLNTGADQTTQGQSLETGTDGIAHAMPLRPGQVEIGARARRFMPAESVKEKVPEEEISREITISLKPQDGDNPVSLLLPAGQPAAGAELWVRPDPGAPAVILRADEAGKVSLPDNAARAPLLVRAPGAASGFVVWDGEADSIRLGSAGPPLTVAARKENGDPGAWARLALWIDGVRYAGPLLQWAFNAQPSDAGGSVTIQGLPPGPLEVLFWSPRQRTAALAETGAFDSRRTIVAFPWPAVVTATMVE